MADKGAPASFSSFLNVALENTGIPISSGFTIFQQLEVSCSYSYYMQMKNSCFRERRIMAAPISPRKSRIVFLLCLPHHTSQGQGLLLLGPRPAVASRGCKRRSSTLIKKTYKTIVKPNTPTTINRRSTRTTGACCQSEVQSCSI